MIEDRLLLEFNLQFFAKDGPGGEKTEEPTAKKLEDSRKEGQVAKSMELDSAFLLIGLFVALKTMSGYIGNRFLEVFNFTYSRFPQMLKSRTGALSIGDTCVLLRAIILRMALCVLPFFAVGFIISFVIPVVQVKWQPTAKPLMPKLDKLSPIKGFKRLFSKEKLVELLKSIVKVAIVASVAYSMIKNEIATILTLYDMALMQAVAYVGNLAIDVGLRISIVYLILGFADFGYQKWKFHDDMKMTKQEVKDEMKNAEGDPHIKGQQRRRMQEASRRRMMSSIPQADVVITNPTHFAVCLKYDADVASAPIVTAKGADFLAQRIKEVARENGVEIVENKPLARMLYHNVPLNGLVPPELYQAVAEVLAFVYNLKNKAG